MCILPKVARQQQGKNGNRYTRNNRRIVERVVSYAVRVISKESRGLVAPNKATTR
jgi:hypothetical protein